MVFFYFGEGLIFFDEQASVYKSVRTLQSSGSDDDISVWLLGIISLIICFVLLLKKKSLKWVVILVCVGISLQSISLLSIEVGFYLLDHRYSKRRLFSWSSILSDDSIFIVGG